jgi:arylsulfatase A-like enzyme
MTGSADEQIPHYRSRSPGGPYWTFDRQKVSLFLPPNSSAPADGQYVFRYPVALEREARLNWEFSGIESADDFVRTTVQVGRSSLSGLLLPAPGIVEWELSLPQNPVLQMKAGIAPPEVLEGSPSDGATLALTVVAEGTEHPVWSKQLLVDNIEALDIDLAPFAGQTVTLRFESRPNKTAIYDYVFLNEPAIVDQKSAPRRVLLVFVDTVRADHLGLYGYERDTDPSLKKLAEGATVFETARSVAPWTLPSTRSVLTGRHPEYFEASPSLSRYVRKRGWASAMFAGNMYLAPNFGLHRDWGLQNVVLWPSATDIVSSALDFLNENPHRDVMMLVHFMDAHLPYQEPESHRHIYAGEPTGGLGEEFHRASVLKARLKTPEDRQYVLDRYDNNIRYINDELERLYARLGPEDIVVYFSDHGEEFWDHGGFEHGHSLYDELLHVPLVIKGPGMTPGRVSEPVSLLDITPTVLDLLKLPSESLDGQSLVAASQHEASALEALRRRNLTFGRPLYGFERWGVLHENKKYTTTEGREELYDLLTDPGESKNLLRRKPGDPGARFRGYLADGLGREASVVYRLAPAYLRTIPQADFVVRLTVPGGVALAWVGDDPTRSSSAQVLVEGETVIATWHKGFRGSREVYIKPNKPMADVTHKLQLSASYGEEAADTVVSSDQSPVLAKSRLPLAKLRVGSRVVSLSFAISPIPNEDTMALSGYDPELASMLQAMGYAVGDYAGDEQQEESGSAQNP